MTVVCKYGKFVDVISGSIVVCFLREDHWNGDMSEIFYSLDIRARKSGLFSDFDTFFTGFTTRNLKEACLVLQSMLAAKDSGVEEWEVPIC